MSILEIGSYFQFSYLSISIDTDVVTNNSLQNIVSATIYCIQDSRATRCAHSPPGFVFVLWTKVTWYPSPSVDSTDLIRVKASEKAATGRRNIVRPNHNFNKNKTMLTPAPQRNASPHALSCMQSVPGREHTWPEEQSGMHTWTIHAHARKHKRKRCALRWCSICLSNEAEASKRESMHAGCIWRLTATSPAFAHYLSIGIDLVTSATVVSLLRPARRTAVMYAAGHHSYLRCFLRVLLSLVLLVTVLSGVDLAACLIGILLVACLCHSWSPNTCCGRSLLIVEERMVMARIRVRYCMINIQFQ